MCVFMTSMRGYTVIPPRTVFFCWLCAFHMRDNFFGGKFSHLRKMTLETFQIAWMNGCYVDIISSNWAPSTMISSIKKTNKKRIKSMQTHKLERLLKRKVEIFPMSYVSVIRHQKKKIFKKMIWESMIIFSIENLKNCFYQSKRTNSTNRECKKTNISTLRPNFIYIPENALWVFILRWSFIRLHFRNEKYSFEFMSYLSRMVLKNQLYQKVHMAVIFLCCQHYA